MTNPPEKLDFSDPMQRPRYTGLPTFFRLPYREDFAVNPPQIGVIGVPYDGGVTNRPGPRHGPREVRNQSSMMRRINHKERPVGMIHIDAHCDTGDGYLGSKFHHGAPFKIAVDEGLLDPKRTAQIGIRGSLFDRDMWKFSFDSGMHVSLDPAFAPGTGTPEAGGLTMREAQGMVRCLAGLDIIGADMVEVSPPFDVGGITALNGATMMFELLCVMAEAVGKRS